MTAAPALKPRLKYKLKIVAGPHLNEVVNLDHDLVRIGRGEENEIKLVNDSRVSRNHAEIIWNGQNYKFRNLSQKNFVLLNGEVVEDGVILPGNSLQIGETIIEVFEEGPILVPVDLSAKAKDPRQSVAVAGAASRNVPIQKTATAPSQGIPPLGPVPGQQQANSQASQRPYRAPVNRGKSNFYIILGLVAAFFIWLLLQDSKPKVTKTFRTSQQVEYDLLQSSSERKKLEEKLQSQRTETAKRAQENLIKGFRDFQQGNYTRARDNFQVVLNLDPDNEIAKRYYHLSKIKFDELLQFHVLQGLRYRDKRNYRMCRSSFQSALVMIQNNANHPKYREIKNFFDECNLAIEGRF